MSTISGIFEPFAAYVRLQLNIRKTILANPINSEISYKIFDPNNDAGWGEQGVGGDSFNEGTETSKIIPLPYAMDNEGRVKATIFEPGSGFQTHSRFLPEEYFYTYTIEKQAIIRMMSGVDLKPEEYQTDGLLEEGWEKQNLKAENLAKQYILEAGTQFYGGGLREGFTTGDPEDDKTRGFSYGDKNIRANADDDFGVVPMPGITSAEIRTKSDDGAIREAKVYWSCHNRRQLEVLELLYMRPGYPVALEWGWNPYISNYGEREQNTLTIKDEFINNGKGKNLNDINDIIRKYKRQSGGNYDGFIGFIKNFEFKVREDGGYDCVTDIMAQGEILESLKFSKMAVEPNRSEKDSGEHEIIDKFLYYLRSLKHNLDKTGDSYFYHNFHKADLRPGHQGLDEEVCDAIHPEARDPEQFWVNTQIYDMNDSYSLYWYKGILCEYSAGELTFRTNHKKRPVDLKNSASFANWVTQHRKKNDSFAGYDQYKGSSYQNQHETYNKKRRIDLNKTKQIYKDGFKDIIQLYSFINKVPYGDVVSSLNNMKLGFGYVKNEYEDGDSGDFFDGFDDQIYEQAGESIYKNSKGGDYWDANAGIGFQSMLGATILKQVSRTKEMTKFESGYKKDIYIRWDLLCQIINHLSTGNSKKYKSTWQKLTNVDADFGDRPEDTSGLSGESSFHPSWTGDPLEGAVYQSTFEAGGSETQQTVSEGPDGGVVYNTRVESEVEAHEYRSEHQYGDLEHLDQLLSPLVEMTYINPGAETWSNSDPNKGKGVWGGRYFYLPYAAPLRRKVDPPKPSIEEETRRHRGDIHTEEQLELQGPTALEDGSIPEYHDTIGHSYDPSICIMPHSPVLNDLFDSGQLWFDKDITDRGHNSWSQHQAIIDHINADPENNTTRNYNPPNTFFKDADVFFKQENDIRTKGRRLGHSSINPINTGLDFLCSFNPHKGDIDNTLTAEDLEGIDDTGKVHLQNQIDGFEQYKTDQTDGTMHRRHSIGLIYLNLDYLLTTYESMRLKKTEPKTEDSEAHIVLDRSFNMFDYVKSIWDGVNDACGGVYDFRIHSEHEKPNKIRIIDFKVQGKPPTEDIYTFEPQGVRSVTRDFYFDSKISNDMSSTISIAAQAPNMATSLDQLSFKAFHKNIQSRFASPEWLDEERRADASASYEQMVRDIDRYNEIHQSLWVFMQKLNSSNWVRYNKKHSAYKMTPDKACNMVTELPNLINSIRHRYPLENMSGQRHPKGGQWRPNTSNLTSAIIPLQFSAKLDGIAGILPLQIFKIDKDRLPVGYKRPDICFIVKSEQHNITDGQDWTVDITGQMALLDNNENDEGLNPRIISREIPRDVDREAELNPEDWINPVITTDSEIIINSNYPYRQNNQWTSLGKYHAGLDIECDSGDQVVAPRDGKIISTSVISGYGNVIIMKFDEPFYEMLQEDYVVADCPEDFGGGGTYMNNTTYPYAVSDFCDMDLTQRENGNPYKPIALALFAHLGTPSHEPFTVSAGDVVKQGDQIGRCGTSAGPSATNSTAWGKKVGSHLHYELGTDNAFWESSEYGTTNMKNAFNLSGRREFYFNLLQGEWQEEPIEGQQGGNLWRKETVSQSKFRQSQSIKLIRAKKYLFDPTRLIDYPDNF